MTSKAVGCSISLIALGAAIGYWLGAAHCHSLLNRGQIYDEALSIPAEITSGSAYGIFWAICFALTIAALAIGGRFARFSFALWWTLFAAALGVVWAMVSEPMSDATPLVYGVAFSTVVACFIVTVDDRSKFAGWLQNAGPTLTFIFAIMLTLVLLLAAPDISRTLGACWGISVTAAYGASVVHILIARKGFDFHLGKCLAVIVAPWMLCLPLLMFLGMMLYGVN